MTIHSAWRRAALVAAFVTCSPAHPLTRSSHAADPPPLVRATPGVAARAADVVLPGPELEAKPATDRKAPLVLRVVSVRPHGDAFRYEFDVTGLDAGSHDLRPFLARKDGKPADGLPPLPVLVEAIRPPGQVEPHAPPAAETPALGGYRTWATAAGVAWGVGLLAILLSFVWPRRKAASTAEAAKPATLAERLRPLVERAAAGGAGREELAALERGLTALWRRRLGLEREEPAAAFEKLRAHPEAGPLLGQLEVWLHRPGAAEPVDVPKLLEPYRNLPPDAADAGGAA